MFQHYRKKLLTITQANYLNLVITSSAIIISSYLKYTRVLPPCAFCTAIRLVLVLLTGLSLGALVIPAHRRLIYPMQLSASVLGLLLSLRQVSFEQSLSRFRSCATSSSNSFQAVLNWLYAGAPVCQKTTQLGYLTLAGWACIIFGLLTLLALQTYFKKPRSSRKFSRS